MPSRDMAGAIVCTLIVHSPHSCLANPVAGAKAEAWGHSIPCSETSSTVSRRPSDTTFQVYRRNLLRMSGVNGDGRASNQLRRGNKVPSTPYRVSVPITLSSTSFSRGTYQTNSVCAEVPTVQGSLPPLFDRCVTGNPRFSGSTLKRGTVGRETLGFPLLKHAPDDCLTLSF